MTPAHATEHGKRSSAQQRRTLLAAGTAGLLGLGLFGCTSASLVAKPERPYWSGRLALQIEEESAQSFSALFELEGSEDQGELILLSPLGNTLGKLKWSAFGATLQTGQQQQASHSLDALLTPVTGEAIPIKAIFDWDGFSLPRGEPNIPLVGRRSLVAWLWRVPKCCPLDLSRGVFGVAPHAHSVIIF